MSLRLSLGIVVIGARAQRSPGTSDGVELYLRRPFRRVDGQSETRFRRRMAEGATVIAGRCGDQRREWPAALDQPQDRIERSADLVREGELERLELQADLPPGQGREPR